MRKRSKQQAATHNPTCARQVQEEEKKPKISKSFTAPFGMYAHERAHTFPAWRGVCMRRRMRAPKHKNLTATTTQTLLQWR